MTKKRILHMINSLKMGGAEKLMVDMLPLMTKEGEQVDLLLLDGEPTVFLAQLKDAGYSNIITLGEGTRLYNPMLILKIKKIIRKYDIVHTHLFQPQYFTAFARLLLPSSGPRLVTTEHNTSNRRRDRKIFYYLDRLVYRQYQQVVCVSDIVKENLEQYLHLNRSYITIPNGIDIGKFAQALPYNNNEVADVPVTVRFIIKVARFYPQKDHATLIKAMSLLPSDVHLLLVGDGPQLADCRQLSESLGLKERIHFLGVRNDIPRLLKTAKIVVMSSFFEGLSLSSLEGMASGNPFVGSNVEGLKEVVDGAGVLFRQGDQEELATIIKRLLQDETYYTQVAHTCMERANQFSIENTTRAYMSLYKSL